MLPITQKHHTWSSINMYPLVNIQTTMENLIFLMGKSTINHHFHPFSIALLVYQGVLTSSTSSTPTFNFQMSPDFLLDIGISMRNPRAPPTNLPLSAAIPKPRSTLLQASIPAIRPMSPPQGPCEKTWKTATTRGIFCCFFFPFFQVWTFDKFDNIHCRYIYRDHHPKKTEK